MNCLILVTAIILNALGNILIKAGMRGSSQATMTILLKEHWLSPTVLGGISCFAFALVAYSYVLSRMNLSVAYPIMTSAGFVIIGLVSVFVFKESIRLTQVLGFGLIVAGIWLVAQTGKN